MDGEAWIILLSFVGFVCGLLSVRRDLKSGNVNLLFFTIYKKNHNAVFFVVLMIFPLFLVISLISIIEALGKQT